MLIAAILLTISGVFLTKWTINSMRQRFRPGIFYKPIAVIIIYFLCIGLIGGGLYCFWKVNYLIVLILLGIFFILMLVRFHSKSEITRAKKILKIYKKLKFDPLFIGEQEILQTTARIYFQNLRWEKSKIDITLESLFESQTRENNIKNLIGEIFIWENISVNKINRNQDSTDQAIDDAYTSVFGYNPDQDSKPMLL